MPNELHTIFKPLESESVENTELQNDQLKDPDTLIAVVKQIRLDLNTAKSEIMTLSEKNNILTIENTNLRERLDRCEASLGVLDKTTETNSISIHDSVDSSAETSAIDTSDDSDSDTAETKKLYKKRKSRHCKEKTQKAPVILPETAIPNEAQIVPLEAANCPTFAFIGNVNRVCSRESIYKHINEKIKLKVKFTDIHELPIKSSMRAFKVAIPSNDLHKLTSSDWPTGVKVEPYHTSKKRTPGRKVPLFQQPRGKSNPSHHQKFPKQPQSSSRWQNDYHRGNKPNWSNWNYHRPDYTQNYYLQSDW